MFRVHTVSMLQSLRSSAFCTCFVSVFASTYLIRSAAPSASRSLPIYRIKMMERSSWRKRSMGNEWEGALTECDKKHEIIFPMRDAVTHSLQRIANRPTCHSIKSSVWQHDQYTIFFNAKSNRSQTSSAQKFISQRVQYTTHGLQCVQFIFINFHSATAFTCLQSSCTREGERAMWSYFCV